MILIIIVSFFFKNPQCLAQKIEENHLSNNVKKLNQEYGKGNNAIIDFYQRWISPVRGNDRCPMYPSCSQYAKIAFSVLPWYKAYPMTCERLLRCGNELYLYPVIQINGSIRSYDPVKYGYSKTHIKVSGDSLKTAYKLYNADFSIDTNASFQDDGFADYLFKNKEYYRAITEYYRLAYTTSDSAKKALSIKKIGLCYYYETDYQRFIDFTVRQDKYLSLHPDIRSEMMFYLAKSYYQLNNYQDAISTLKWNTDNNDSLFYNDKKFILGISYARLFDWHNAVEQLSLINNDYPHHKATYNIIQFLNKYENIPQKNPILAGILSATIPGTGYFYSGQKKTGISSFILNGLFALTIRESIIKKNYWLAGSVSFLGIGWYIGNITGSVDAAHNYNKYIYNKFINRILKKENYTEYMKKRN